MRNLLENSDQATLPATNTSQSSDADEISVVFSNGSDRASSSVFSSIENIHHGSSTVLSSIDANTTLQASSAILSSDDDEDSFQACSLIDSGIDANQRSKGSKNGVDSFLTFLHSEFISREEKTKNIYSIPLYVCITPISLGSSLPVKIVYSPSYVSFFYE